jgi:hypothetical protein
LNLEAIISLPRRLPIHQAQQTEAPEALKVESLGADPRTPSGIEQDVGAQSFVALLSRAAHGDKREWFFAVLLWRR